MRHGFSNCFSQVEANAYMELNGGTSPSLSPKEPKAPNLCKNSKATNGPATDSQSIYARVCPCIGFVLINNLIKCLL
jgi:hypothetical protein